MGVTPPQASAIVSRTAQPKEDAMLSSSRMIGFVLTTDSKKARDFYEQKLGFQFISDDAYALVMRAGETMIRVGKGIDFTPAANTVLGWEVEDIQAMVSWLKARGVVFEKYPFVQDKELAIWTAPTGDRVAWFKDPDGNVLSVSQHQKLP
jgi:catechol 2,3-dioxygenase-like lactoylglutathione lyase family enzyme